MRGALLRVLGLAALGLGCHSITVPAPHPGRLRVPRLPGTATVTVEPESARLVHAIGGTSAGLAHRFRLEVGRSLVEYADAYCARAFASGDEHRIEVEIERFDLAGGAAELVTRFRVTRGGEEIFEARYEAAGPPRAGLPGSGSPPPVAGYGEPESPTAMELPLRQALHDVLTLTLETFFEELAEALEASPPPDE